MTTIGEIDRMSNSDAAESTAARDRATNVASSRAGWFVVAALCFLVGSVYGYIRNQGSPDNGVYFKNDEVMGVASSEPSLVIFELVNDTNQPVGLLGGNVSCGCVSFGVLPESVPPHSTTPIEVTLKADQSDATGTVDLVLFADRDGLREIHGRVMY